jgi:hypothetical protein
MRSVRISSLLKCDVKGAEMGDPLLVVNRKMEASFRGAKGDIGTAKYPPGDELARREFITDPVFQWGRG